LSPPAKLDVRFSYTVAEAHQFFAELTPLESQKYFWGEWVDIWFMINYSWLLLIWGSFLGWKKKAWIVITTGLLDLGETSLILCYLSGYPMWMEGMRWFSTIKWSVALLTLVCLVIFSLRRKSPTA
jgi:hypothetical protein